MSTTIHNVKGMTCEQSLSSASAEISKLAGFTDIAVDEAGYELVR